jgi:putative membrane protein
MEEKCLKKIPKDQFEKTKIIASNQGLYNDFLEAVLIRSL